MRKLALRIGRITLGVLLVIVGFIGLFLPIIQGLLCIFLGLTLLSVDIPAAKRLRDRVLVYMRKQEEKLFKRRLRKHRKGARAAMKGFIGVHSDGWNFVNKETGEVFVPFGANYFDPETGWAPKLWQKFDEQRVRKHFEMMADLGTNCARVFLTAGSFQPEPDKVSEEALGKLDAMVAIARDTGIRLNLTGPDHWEGTPDYLKPDKYAGEAALAALELFWRTLAARYREEPAIFAWDLLNEPMIPWHSDDMLRRWRCQAGERGEIPPNANSEADEQLYQYQLFRESIAWEWTHRQAEAIRSVDPNHMVTIGMIQWSFPFVRAHWGDHAHQPGWYSAFNPKELASLLDFTCVHFYPLLGDPGEPEMAKANAQYLKAVVNYCYAGKPVLLGEYGWAGGGEFQGAVRPESYLTNWNSLAIESTRELASGWLVWAFSDTPDATDCTKFGGLYKVTGELKEWGKRYRELALELTAKPLTRTTKLRGVPIGERQAFTADVRPLLHTYLIASRIIEDGTDERQTPPD